MVKSSKTVAASKQPQRIATPGRERQRRLSGHDRRAQIVAAATAFFAKHGFNGQTRSLAEACGVSQRLLYKFFESKSDLIKAVYETAVAPKGEVTWIEGLQDRSRSIEDRLTWFYSRYISEVFSEQWGRLFLFRALAFSEDRFEQDWADRYTREVLHPLFDVIAIETAIAIGAEPPSPTVRLQIGWLIHGAVSHAILRRDILRTGGAWHGEQQIRFLVRCFIAAYPTAVVSIPSN